MYIVTGAAGFIGSALVWELNQHGINDVICADDFGTEFKWKNLSKSKFLHFVLKDDLFRFLNQPDVIDSVKCVFHMGACSSTTEKDMDFLLKNNVYYTQELFKWCTRNKKKFIYASSAATYGGGELGYDDATPAENLKPMNGYGYSKVLFDRWALAQINTPPTWLGLKFFNVYGPNEYHKGEMSSVVYKAFNQIGDGGSLKLFKSYKKGYAHGKQMRDFVYIKDVTRWMWELSKKENTKGIYNMGFGQARTWLDLGKNVFKSMGKKQSIKLIEMPKHIRDQYQYFTEAKMDRLFGLGVSKPEWPLERGISDYVERYLAKPDQYL